MGTIIIILMVIMLFQVFKIKNLVEDYVDNSIKFTELVSAMPKRKKAAHMRDEDLMFDEESGELVPRDKAYYE